MVSQTWDAPYPSRRDTLSQGRPGLRVVCQRWHGANCCPVSMWGNRSPRYPPRGGVLWALFANGCRKRSSLKICDSENLNPGIKGQETGLANSFINVVDEFVVDLLVPIYVDHVRALDRASKRIQQGIVLRTCNFFCRLDGSQSPSLVTGLI